MITERVNELEKMTYEQLRNWIELSLSECHTGAIDLSDYDEVTEAVVDVARMSSNCEYQQRFRKAIAELISAWSSQYYNHSEEYLSRLAVVCGRLRVVSSLGSLVRHAKSGRFKGRIVRGQDLHQTILRVLWGLGITDPPVKDVFAHEIMEDHRYAELCFNALYEIDFIHSLRYLPERIRLAAKYETRDDWHRSFTRFVHSASRSEFEVFAKRLPRIVGRLSESEVELLERAMHYCGTEAVPNWKLRLPETEFERIMLVQVPKGKEGEPVEIPCIPALAKAQMGHAKGDAESRVRQYISVPSKRDWRK